MDIRLIGELASTLATNPKTSSSAREPSKPSISGMFHKLAQTLSKLSIRFPTSLRIDYFANPIDSRKFLNFFELYFAGLTTLYNHILWWYNNLLYPYLWYLQSFMILYFHISPRTTFLQLFTTIFCGAIAGISRDLFLIRPIMSPIKIYVGAGV